MTQNFLVVLFEKILSVPCKSSLVIPRQNYVLSWSEPSIFCGSLSLPDDSGLLDVPLVPCYGERVFRRWGNRKNPQRQLCLHQIRQGRETWCGQGLHDLCTGVCAWGLHFLTHVSLINNFFLLILVSWIWIDNVCRLQVEVEDGPWAFGWPLT